MKVSLECGTTTPVLHICPPTFYFPNLCPRNYLNGKPLTQFPLFCQLLFSCENDCLEPLGYFELMIIGFNMYIIHEYIHKVSIVNNVNKLKQHANSWPA